MYVYKIYLCINTILSIFYSLICVRHFLQVIEEKPPKCPYEILSLKTEQEVCVVNYTQYFKQFDSCPSIMSLRDLRISCGNPVETKWRIKITYNKDVTERNMAVICQGRENCEVSTLYWVTQL